MSTKRDAATTKAMYLQPLVLLACQHDEFGAAAIFIER